MTNLEPLWRRMARKLLRVKAQNIQIAFESELRSELAGVLGAAQALLEWDVRYPRGRNLIVQYGDVQRSEKELDEICDTFRRELERLLKGEG